MVQFYIKFLVRGGGGGGGGGGELGEETDNQCIQNTLISVDRAHHEKFYGKICVLQ